MVVWQKQNPIQTDLARFSDETRLQLGQLLFSLCINLSMVQRDLLTGRHSLDIIAVTSLVLSVKQ